MVVKNLFSFDEAIEEVEEEVVGGDIVLLLKFFNRLRCSGCSSSESVVDLLLDGFSIFSLFFCEFFDFWEFLPFFISFNSENFVLFSLWHFLKCLIRKSSDFPDKLIPQAEQ